MGGGGEVRVYLPFVFFKGVTKTFCPLLGFPEMPFYFRSD